MFGAVRELLSSPGLWRYAAVPMVTLVLLASVGIAVVTWLGVPHLLHLFVTGESQEWYARVGSAALATLLWLLSSAVVLLVSWVVTPILCAPALEAIVRRVESALGAPPHPELSFWASFSCGVRAQLMGLSTLLPTWFALWVVGFFFPFLMPVLFPAKLVAIAFSLTWNLFDYPLTLRGVPARQRLRFVRRHLSAVVGFGLAFACLFWIPLAAVLLLPLGVIAATRLVWTLSQSEVGRPDGILLAARREGSTD